MTFTISNIFESMQNATDKVALINDSGFRLIDTPYLEDHEKMTVIGMNSKNLITDDDLKFLLRRLPDYTVVMDISVSENSCFLKLIDCHKFNTRLIVTYCQNNSIDWLYRKLPHYLNQAGVAVFDLESTLVEQEYMETIAEKLLSKQQLAAIEMITEQAMNDEIDLIDSFEQRVELLKGIPFEKLNEIASQPAKFSEHVQPVVAELLEMGFKVSVATGGFEPFAGNICAQLKITEYCCNHFTLEQLDDQEILTGALAPEIIDAQAKSNWLMNQWEKHQCEEKINIAIGDGANDLEMLQTSDLAVGYKPKSIVLKNADMNIVHSDFRFLARTLQFLTRQSQSPS